MTPRRPHRRPLTPISGRVGHARRGDSTIVNLLTDSLPTWRDHLAKKLLARFGSPLVCFGMSPSWGWCSVLSRPPRRGGGGYSCSSCCAWRLWEPCGVGASTSAGTTRSHSPRCVGTGVAVRPSDARSVFAPAPKFAGAAVRPRGTCWEKATVLHRQGDVLTTSGVDQARAAARDSGMSALAIGSAWGRSLGY